jgi:VWFA-related protein
MRARIVLRHGWLYGLKRVTDTDDRIKHLMTSNLVIPQIIVADCQNDLEIWSFSVDDKEAPVMFVFYRNGRTFRLWDPTDGIDPLVDINGFARSGQFGTPEQFHQRIMRESREDSQSTAAGVLVAKSCRNPEVRPWVKEAITRNLGHTQITTGESSIDVDFNRVRVRRQFEENKSLLNSVTFSEIRVADDNCNLPEASQVKPYKGEVKTFAFVEKDETIRVQIASLLNTKDLVAGVDNKTYGVRVCSTVYRANNVFQVGVEHRFDGGSDSESIPVVFDKKFLEPGNYELSISILDVNSNIQFVHWRDLVVPSKDVITAAVKSKRTAGAKASAKTEGSPMRGAANQRNPDTSAVSSNEPDSSTKVKILPPWGNSSAGMTQVKVLFSPDIKRIAFKLNGKPLFSKSTKSGQARGFMNVSIDLGDKVVEQKLVAQGLGEDRSPIASAFMIYNPSSENKNTLHFVSPADGQSLTDKTRIELVVSKGENSQIKDVQITFNGEEVPLEHAKKEESLSELRVSLDAKLEGGKALGVLLASVSFASGQTLEGFVTLNRTVDEDVRVDMVELLVSSEDSKLPPVEKIVVTENGTAQQINGITPARNLSKNVGLLLDVSQSMKMRMNTLVESASSFLRSYIWTPESGEPEPIAKNRASLTTFSKTVEERVPLTENLDVLLQGLSGLSTRSTTVFYEAVIHEATSLGQQRGPNILIVISDGKDEGSRYDFKQLMEAIQRSNVLIYTVGIGLGHNSHLRHRRELKAIADYTGGRFIHIDISEELPSVYEMIQKDLDDRFLISYQSNIAAKKKPRRLKVVIDGKKAFTRKEYLP